MGTLWRTIRVGFLDMRLDVRRFVMLALSLALGTALVAGVQLVGSAVSTSMDSQASVLMGGTFELSRADRRAEPGEIEQFASFGQVVEVVDTNVRAENGDAEAFIDLVAVGAEYPLFGTVSATGLPEQTSIFSALERQDEQFGALVSPLLLDALDLSIGDTFRLAGTALEVRGTLLELPDAIARGFRLGVPVLVTTDAFSSLSDRTSPLPGLGNWFRYKLRADGDADAIRASLDRSFTPEGWTVRSAREGLGPVVQYYDLFMRFLVLVGIGSLLLVGLSVWTGMRAYVAERSNVIAILRSLGAERSRIFVHFSAQIVIVALVGIGLGLVIGSLSALSLLPIIGRAVGIPLDGAIALEPLAVPAAAGLITVFAFSYLPLLQAQAVRPVELFRARGLAPPAGGWRTVFGSWLGLPLLAAALGFMALAVLMAGDPAVVMAFVAVGVGAALLFLLFIRATQKLFLRVPSIPWRPLRQAMRAIAGAGANTSAVVVSVGMTMALLIFVLVLQANLRLELLGASAFEVPTYVASDLFDDEAEALEALSGTATGIERVVSTPMLRGALTQINGAPVDPSRTRGPEASFLLTGDVPLTFRAELPASSRLETGEWWPADYVGPPLVSLHRNLGAGLGIGLGDTLTFDIFGDQITAQVANFRDYSWQGGIDFLVSFSPGVLEPYPTMLFAAVTASDGRETDAERLLIATLPDVRFIQIGDTLEQVTQALSQLSLAVVLVGALALGNGLLVLGGSIGTGRRQRRMDAVITKVLGATRGELLLTAALQFLLLALIATVPAIILGLALARSVSGIMLSVGFVLDWPELALLVLVGSVVVTVLGALAIAKVSAAWPARLLREAV